MEKNSPPKRGSLIPYLLVAGVKDLLVYLEQALGATTLLALDAPNGRVMHAEVLIEGSMVMMGEPPEGLDLMPGSIYLTVSDCDAVYARALESGGKSIMEVMDMPHAGERYGGVQDPAGNIWWIASQIDALSEEEQRRRIEAGMVPKPKF